MVLVLGRRDKRKEEKKPKKKALEHFFVSEEKNETFVSEKNQKYLFQEKEETRNKNLKFLFQKHQTRR